ncbi:hypothetical protein [Herpetosiphon sp. NSE202]
MSIYLTQLIYLHADQSAAFEQFEALVLPLLAQYTFVVTHSANSDKGN